MKILFITSYFPPIAGGSAVVYYNLCRHLGKEACVLTTWRHYISGMEITGWKNFDQNQSYKISRTELLRPLIKVTPPRHLAHAATRVLAEDLPLRLRTLAAALHIIRQEQVDIVCLGELYALSWLARTLKTLKKIPCLFYIHGEEITTGSVSRFYGRQALQVLGEAKAITAVSCFTRDELIKKNFNSERIHVLPNGVDLAKFNHAQNHASEIISRHRLTGKKVMLTVGRIERRKGHDVVIQALPLISQHVPNVVYLVVGIGSDVDRLQELCRKYQVTERVIFAGLVSEQELASYYYACDLFVMPNRTLENGDTEGFGLVFLEANACGKPVIGGRAGGVPEAVLHNQTGLLVNGESVHEFAEAAIRLLTDENFARQLAENGYHRAQSCDWSAKAAAFREICQQAIA